MSADRPADAPWTVLPLVTTTAEYLTQKGIAAARLDAEVLLAGVLGVTRIQLYAHHDRPLAPAELDHYREAVRRRASGEPVARIRGQKEFYSLTFEVNEAVLVPRPETEVLVDEALSWMREHTTQTAPRILEIGTGSGCIAVAVARQIPEATVVATDRSAAALGVAARNVATHDLVERIALREGDLFEALEPSDRGEGFDLVLCNPPYIAPDEALPREVAAYDPPEALYAAEEGMACYRGLAQGLDAVLAPGGVALIELAADRAEAAGSLFRAAGFAHCDTVQDLAGIERVLRVSHTPLRPKSPGVLVYEPLARPAPEAMPIEEGDPAAGRDPAAAEQNDADRAAEDAALNQILDAYAEPAEGDQPGPEAAGDQPPEPGQER